MPAASRLLRLAFGVIAIVACMGAFAGTALAAPANPHGRFLGIVGKAGAPGQSQLAAAPLVYHQGPVMHSDVNYSIYWEPSGTAPPPPPPPPPTCTGFRCPPASSSTGPTTTATSPTTSTYKNLVDAYFTNVGHDSGTQGNVYSVATEYSDNAGPLAYNASFGGRIIDTAPYPVSGCPDPSGNPCLTDAQIQAEISSVVAANNLPRGLNTIYYLFTPSGVDSCFDSSGSSCTYNAFCAYHSWTGSGTTALLYANMPYAARSGCDPGQRPNGDAADATLNVVSHENIEALTDPLGTGWWDSSGAEIGDKCNFTFGAALGGATGAHYNQIISSSQYWLQEEWSNGSSACLQRESTTDPPPVSSFTYTPPSPISGQAVQFDGTGSSDPAGGTITNYSWTFGDGTTATGATPTHTYTGAQTVTVKLVVTDSDGETASTSRTITVGASVDLPPQASFTFSPTSPSPFQTVAFDGTGSSDPGGGSITGWSWSFGDGGSGTGPNPAHQYSFAGTYTVTLTVTDSDGETASTANTITVLGGRFGR